MSVLKSNLLNDAKIQEIQNQLLEIYPNKIVERISSQTNLYSFILRYSKMYNMSISDFIESLGFKVKIQRKTMKSLEECLLEIYPNKHIVRLREIDSNVYDRIRSYAKKEGKKITQYLEDIGFTYEKSSYRKIKLKLNIKDELLKIYPNGIVFNLYKESPLLYQKLYRLSQKQKTTINEFLENMGFEYENLGRDNRTIEECLLSIYPNKVVLNLMAMDNKLYKRIHKECVKKEINMEDYVESIGFQYKRLKDSNLNTKRRERNGCIVR